MKIALIAAAFCGTAALTLPAIAQLPQTRGTVSQTSPIDKNAANGGRPAGNADAPATGTSAHQNKAGNNSTSPSDGPAGTPVPNGEKTVAGTSTTNAPDPGQATSPQR